VAGMESGELGIWDPSKIVAHAKYVFSSLCDGKSDMTTTALPRLSYSRILRTPDPFVDWTSIPFNLLCLPRGVLMERYMHILPCYPIRPYLFQVYIWDLKDPSKPYSPGTRSSKLDEVSALAWNNQVPHVLATASGTGYTVVWDLRGKREVVALAYGGGAGGNQTGTGRRGMSDVGWHPDNVCSPLHRE
jgi:protein transport protein SEC31